MNNMSNIELNKIEEAFSHFVKSYEGNPDIAIEQIMEAAQEGRTSPNFDLTMAKIAESSSALELYRMALELREKVGVFESLRRRAEGWFEGEVKLPAWVIGRWQELSLSPNPQPVYRSASLPICDLPFDPANQTVTPGTIAEAIGTQNPVRVEVDGLPANLDDRLIPGSRIEAFFEVQASEWTSDSEQVPVSFLVLDGPESQSLDWAIENKEKAPVSSALILFQLGQFGTAEACLELWTPESGIDALAIEIRNAAQSRRENAAKLVD